MPDLKLSNYLYQAGSALEDTSKVIGGFASELIGAENNVLAATHSTQMQQKANSKLLELKGILADPNRWQDLGNGNYTIDGKPVQEYLDAFGREAQDDIQKNVKSWGAQMALKTQYLPRVMNGLSVGVNEAFVDARMGNAKVNLFEQIDSLKKTLPADKEVGLAQYDALVQTGRPFLSVEERTRLEIDGRNELVKEWFFADETETIKTMIADPKKGYAAVQARIGGYDARQSVNGKIKPATFLLTRGDRDALLAQATMMETARQSVNGTKIMEIYDAFYNALPTVPTDGSDQFAAGKKALGKYPGWREMLSDLADPASRTVYQNLFEALEKKMNSTSEGNAYVSLTRNFGDYGTLEASSQELLLKDAEAYTNNTNYPLDRRIDVVGMIKKAKGNTTELGIVKDINQYYLWAKHPLKVEMPKRIITKAILDKALDDKVLERADYEKYIGFLDGALTELKASGEDSEWISLLERIQNGEIESADEALVLGGKIGSKYMLPSYQFFLTSREQKAQTALGKVNTSVITAIRKTDDYLAKLGGVLSEENVTALNDMLASARKVVDDNVATLSTGDGSAYSAAASLVSGLQAKITDRFSKSIMTGFIGRLSDAKTRDEVSFDEISKAFMNTNDFLSVLGKWEGIHGESVESAATRRISEWYSNRQLLDGGVSLAQGKHALDMSDLDAKDIPANVAEAYRLRLTADLLNKRGMTEFSRLAKDIKAGATVDIWGNEALSFAQKTTLDAQLDEATSTQESITASTMASAMVKIINNLPLEDGEVPLTRSYINTKLTGKTKEKWSAWFDNAVVEQKNVEKNDTIEGIKIDIMEGVITDPSALKDVMKAKGLTETQQSALMAYHRAYIREETQWLWQADTMKYSSEVYDIQSAISGMAGSSDYDAMKARVDKLPDTVRDKSSLLDRLDNKKEELIGIEGGANPTQNAIDTNKGYRYIDENSINTRIREGKITDTEIKQLAKDGLITSNQSLALQDDLSKWSEYNKQDSNKQNENKLEALRNLAERTLKHQLKPGEVGIELDDFKAQIPILGSHDVNIQRYYGREADSLSQDWLNENFRQKIVALSDKTWDSGEFDEAGAKALEDEINGSVFEKKSELLAQISTVRQNAWSVAAAKEEAAQRKVDKEAAKQAKIEKDSRSNQADLVLSAFQARAADTAIPMTETEYIGYAKQLQSIFGPNYDEMYTYSHTMDLEWELKKKGVTAEEAETLTKIDARLQRAMGEYRRMKTIPGYVHDPKTEYLTQELIDELCPIPIDANGNVTDTTYSGLSKIWSDSLFNFDKSMNVAEESSSAAVTTLTKAYTVAMYTRVLGWSNPFPDENIPELTPKLVSSLMPMLRNADVKWAGNLVDEVAFAIAKKQDAAQGKTVDGASQAEYDQADFVLRRLETVQKGVVASKKIGYTGDTTLTYNIPGQKDPVVINFSPEGLLGEIRKWGWLLEKTGKLQTAYGYYTNIETTKDVRFDMIQTTIDTLVKKNPEQAATLNANAAMWIEAHPEATVDDVTKYSKSITTGFLDLKAAKTMDMLSGRYDITEAANDAIVNGDLSCFIGLSGNDYVPLDPKFRAFMDVMSANTLKAMDQMGVEFSTSGFTLKFSEMKNVKKSMDSKGRITFTVTDEKVLAALGYPKKEGVKYSAQFYLGNVITDIGSTQTNALLVMELTQSQAATKQNYFTAKAFVPWEREKSSPVKTRLGRWIEVRKDTDQRKPLVKTDSQANIDLNNVIKIPESELMRKYGDIEKSYRGDVTAKESTRLGF